MTRSQIPLLTSQQERPFSPTTFLQSIPNNQLPASPPTTPLFYSSESCITSIPSPSSSYASLTTSSTKNLRPKLSKSTSIASENIQVMVRCRLPSDREILNHEQDCWVLSPEQGTVKLDESNGTIFEYDRVFKGADNSEIYDSGIQKLVRSTMEGYNGTVLAYGQTASGKTYTMTGTSNEPGVIPKAVDDVFAYIEEEAIDREFLLQVSYMEIYNEKINDLLSTEQSSNGLSIRTTTHGLDQVENLTAMTVTTPDEVIAYIKAGEERRHTSETDFNKNSSRSHTIFQLIIESKPKLSSLTSVRTSRLNLIDLAGSEKVASNTERRQEGSYINKSLLTLGKVITQLNEGARHIPYRDSKLTRILSSSLSGNDRVVVICTINPAWKSKDESTNTLRFAQGVKKVRISPKLTQVARNSRLQNYKEQIAGLEMQMQRKTEQEAETKERLSHLLSLILTSSKTTTQNATTSKLAEAVTDPELLLNGSIGDVVKECEEHLSASIYKHQDEIKRRDQDIHQIEDRFAQCQKALEEKSMMIEELQMTIHEYHGINEDLQSQLDKYRNSFVEVNKRWNGLESSINDYKERLVVSEGKVAMLEAQQKADDHIKKQLEQQLEDFKAEMEQRLQDDGLIGMVRSLRDDLDDEDNDLDTCSDIKTEHLEELDHLMDYDMNHDKRDYDDDQQLLTDLKHQLQQTKLEAEQQRQAYMAELEKEREHSSICRTKIYQVQTQLDQVETALKQAKIDEVEHALNLAKLKQVEKDAAKNLNNNTAPQLSTGTLPSLASSDECELTSSGRTLLHFISRFLYLDYSACVLLLAFAFWLFV